MHRSLADAVDRVKREPGTPSNAYDWYRKCATRDGTVWLGHHRIGAVKLKRQWMVDAADLEDALNKHREQRAEVDRMTSYYLLTDPPPRHRADRRWWVLGERRLPLPLERYGPCSSARQWLLALEPR
ncbi:hypothetical protein [Rhodococcus qingshengii]|uniref:hypothetical protein n=1 Tax=Rhodococcus qingshengii TaxID=334542 RepID=UPI0022B59FEC|nr:hypothetical protein [Rhodococcus qingshengii]MCZ4618707.1 hypothetical protein [Rhodococcus qingshengii]